MNETDVKLVANTMSTIRKGVKDCFDGELDRLPSLRDGSVQSFDLTLTDPQSDVSLGLTKTARHIPHLGVRTTYELTVPSQHQEVLPFRPFRFTSMARIHPENPHQVAQYALRTVFSRCGLEGVDETAAALLTALQTWDRS